MKHLLLFLALAVMAVAQPTTKLISAGDLQNWWPLENGAGGGTTTAKFGGTNGTCTGTTAATGLLGGCLSFNGSSDFVDCSTTFRPVYTQAISVSCWVNDSQVNGATHVAFSNLSGAANFGVELGVITSNKAYFIMGFGATAYRRADSVSTVSQGVWHHLVGTWDGSSTSTVYLDGVGNSTGNSAGSAGTITYTVNTTIGKAGNLSNFYWNGKIDDVKCYNHKMTQGEVNYLYYAGRQGTGR